MKKWSPSDVCYSCSRSCFTLSFASGIIDSLDRLASHSGPRDQVIHCRVIHRKQFVCCISGHRMVEIDHGFRALRERNRGVDPDVVGIYFLCFYLAGTQCRPEEERREIQVIGRQQY